MNRANHLSLRTAFSWIFFSTLLITGGAWGGWFLYKQLERHWEKDPSYSIVAIVQSSNDYDSLPTLFFAEILKLSKDEPTNLYAFDTHFAKRKLASCPLIKAVDVKRIKPGSLYIDYALRQPSFYLRDVKNGSVDEEGIIFPFSPFFTPKNIPELVIGDTKENLKWGHMLDGKKLALAKSVRDEIERHFDHQLLRIKRIDVSRINATSYGQRELIVILEEVSYDQPLNVETTILRLHHQEYLNGIALYKRLCEYLGKSTRPQIVNLRIPDLAFILP